MDILNIKPIGKADKTSATFQDSTTAFNDPVAFNAAIPFGGSDYHQDVYKGANSIDSIKPITSSSKL